MKSLLIKSHLAEQAKLEKMRVIDNPAELAQVSGGDCEISYELVPIPFLPDTYIEVAWDEVCVEVLDDDGSV
ncbi:MAG: hypothetical protein JNM52_05130 [Betaproteobacteria bacterium]|nr:hypothetical protein [Betaproteobacteria bacterium]